MKKLCSKINQQGVSLVETLIGITILAFVSISLYALFDLTLKVVWENKARAGAQVLVNQQMEIVHNLPYIDVGTLGGIPSGPLLQNSTTTINNIQYNVKTAVLYVDDPFDGILGGAPDDLLPTDYKRIRVEVAWNFRLQHKPVVFISDIAPFGLESDVGGGTIRITILNSSGLPVPQANVNILNSSISPEIDLDMLTNDNGQVLLPGATSSVETYFVVVTKPGYSKDQTYAIDPVNLPSPARPPLTVIEGSVTDVSFSIDLVSSLNISAINTEYLFCDITKAETDTKFASDYATFHIAASDWWDSNWSYRRQITFNNLAQTENLTNFPTLIHLDSSNFDFTKAQALGGDIRFTNESQGTTVLDYEIESWDSIAQEAFIWVNIPQIDGSSDTDGIWIYYGNTSASDSQNPTAVWDSNFVIVQHLDETSGSHLDSTSYNNDSTSVNGPTQNATGQINGSDSFDGNNDTIQFGNDASLQLSGAMTVEAWVKNDDLSIDRIPVGKEASSGNRGFKFKIQDIPTNRTVQFTVYANAAGNPNSRVESNTSINTGTWYYLSSVYQPSSYVRIYINGALDNQTTNNVISSQYNNSNQLTVGQRSLEGPDQNYYFDGLIDELRISNTARSADWIAAQYQSMNGTFASFGAEEYNGPPIGPTDIYIAGDVGSDITGDGSIGNPYQTIAKGLQDVVDSDGDTINVKGQLTYNEDIDLTSAHSGAAATPTVIRAWAGTGQPTIAATDNGIHINGGTWITVSGFAVTGGTGSGILVTGSSSNISLKSNTISGSDGRGILVKDASINVIIQNNLIYETGSDGIKLEASSNSPSLFNNTIDSSAGAGIYLDTVDSPYLRNNILSSNISVGIQGNAISNVDTDYNIYFGNSTSTAGFTYGPNRVLKNPLYVDSSNDDYHLQSLKGYYPFGVGDVSLSHSPAIDTGDPTSAYTAEPVPNGCNVNFGSYGNTNQASKSTEVGDPVPNLDFTLSGAKSIGLDTDGLPVLKYSQATATDSSGVRTIANLEWDSYTILVSATSTGYDIAYLDPYIPVNLLPDTTTNVTIGLVVDTQHTQHVLVLDSVSGLPEEDAQVRLYNSGFSYDETKSTLAHGQVFFKNLQAGTYNLEVIKSGFQIYSSTVDVSWYSTEIVNLVP